MIHQYKLNGFNIVLDVNSGSVHVVDDITYDIIEAMGEKLEKKPPESLFDKLDRYSKEDIKEAYAEIYSLYENGELFSDDDYKQFAGMLKDAPIKAMCLHIAHDCNLRCEYCFAATGDFGGKRKLMDFETGKAAIDFLIENSGTRRNLEIDFFGGEPLMNFETVKKIVEYAREKEKKHGKNFRFTLTTNGLLLDDEKIDYINREMSNVVLSIDGRKEVNDRLRKTVSGGGSYDIITEKYKKLVEKRKDKDYYVRGTFTKYNLDFTKDVLHLNEIGFDQISIEPVVGDESDPYAITKEDLPRIYDEYLTLAREMLDRKENKFNFFHFMIDLEQGPCAIKRLRGCGCGNEYIAVTPDGDIYPCHQFVGNEEWKMGSVYDKSINREMKKSFAEANIYGKKECGGCWAKFYCSGGCNANNMQYAGSILNPYEISCELEKKRLECAIMMKAAKVLEKEGEE